MIPDSNQLTDPLEMYRTGPLHFDKLTLTWHKQKAQRRLPIASAQKKKDEKGSCEHKKKETHA